MQRRPIGLWRQADFQKLWAGETISLLGSQVTLLAMPLLAAMALEATPIQMGALGTLQYIPWLLVGLPAGVWADRLRRRPIMIAADVGRALLLALIPLAALTNALRIEHLYIVGFLTGMLNVLFEVAYSAYLPTLVARDRLVEGNSTLQASASAAEIAGPGLGGGLVQLVGAPLAIAVDAISFLGSALSLAWIRTPEPGLPPAGYSRCLFPEMREGLRLVFGNPILRAFTLTSATGNFFVDVHLAIFVLFATRDLGVTPVILGGMYAVASLGGLLGSVVAARLAGRLGLGRAIVAGHIQVILALLIIPLSGPQIEVALPLIVLAQALWGFGSVVYVVNSVSLRQAITPNQYQGRVAASIRFVSWGVSPVGFMLGGILGEMLGLRATLLAAGAGSLASLLILLLSPICKMRLTTTPADSLSPSRTGALSTDI
jgi:MFS family permease